MIHATRFTAGLSSVYTIPNSGNSNPQDIICNELFVPTVQLKNSSIIVTVSPCRPHRAHMSPARPERSHINLPSSCLARSQLSAKKGHGKQASSCPGAQDGPRYAYGHRKLPFHRLPFVARIAHKLLTQDLPHYESTIRFSS